jgi:pyridoxamine 5'-phosphate oxidase
MSAMDLAGLRREYSDRGIGVTDLTAHPMDQFAQWFEEIAAAVQKSDAAWFEPNAVVLSTAAPAAADRARPSSRTVLLKAFGPEGFTVFTNYRSRKGRELAANPDASLLFPWYPLERQVIASGSAVRLSDEENDAYFSVRPRGSRLGAWASEQSEPLGDRAVLDARYAGYDRRFPGEVPRPPYWGGFRIEPAEVEFWQGRPSRLHDRLVYLRDPDAAGGWRIERRNP